MSDFVVEAFPQDHLNLNVTTEGEKVDYIIRYENNGTDTINEFLIEATLSSKLDAKSLLITGSSHPCEANVMMVSLRFNSSALSCHQV